MVVEFLYAFIILYNSIYERLFELVRDQRNYKRQEPPVQEIPVLNKATKELITQKLFSLSSIYDNLDCKYKTFYVSKGYKKKRRRIDAPVPELRKIQTWILKHILYPYYSIYCHSAGVGFMPGRNTVDAVVPHIGRLVIFTADIKDFFPSIKTYRIAKVLEKVSFFDEEHRQIILKICCKNGALPQGAPTSPFLSNLVMYEIDENLQQQCNLFNKKFDCKLTYTRYADDLIFSRDELSYFGTTFLADYLKIQVDMLGRALSYPEIQLNYRKIKRLRNYQRQKILGIVVNEKLSVPCIDRKKLRAQLHQCACQLLSIPEDAQGKLAYIKSINQEQYKTLIKHYVYHYNRTAEFLDENNHNMGD